MEIARYEITINYKKVLRGAVVTVNVSADQNQVEVLPLKLRKGLDSTMQISYRENSQSFQISSHLSSNPTAGCSSPKLRRT